MSEEYTRQLLKERDAAQENARRWRDEARLRMKERDNAVEELRVAREERDASERKMVDWRHRYRQLQVAREDEPKREAEFGESAALELIRRVVKPWALEEESRK